MRDLRFSIASILGAIFFVAVGFAALREADELWDSGLFSMTLGVLLLSVLLAVHRSKTRRAFWIGFALFGWGYLGLSLIPSTESRLITTRALVYLDSKVSEESLRNLALGFLRRGPGVSNYGVQTVVDGTRAVTSSQGVVRMWDLTTGRLVRASTGATDNRIRIGHSLFALLAAWIGGMFSRRLGRVSVAPEVSVAQGAAG